MSHDDCRGHVRAFRVDSGGSSSGINYELHVLQRHGPWQWLVAKHQGTCFTGSPPFALERLARINDVAALVYRLPKPLPDGRWSLVLTPLALLERLSRHIETHRIGFTAFQA